MTAGTGWQWRLKRVHDLVVGTLALLILSPVLLLVALAIKLGSPGPAFYPDTRIGRGERPFRMIKFRTMVQDADRGPLGYKMVRNDPRITAIGRLLRRFSLDELPQLINVLRGDMSLVGPRPMLPVHLPHLDAAQRRRFTVRPGLTGLAQVSGRNDISWAERIALDLEYIDRFWIGLDVRIVLRTVAVVLRGSALYSDLQQRDTL
jgi:lipopolysaccharide/colanic/teichoic acid biosynthesis glycosyltransferase